MRCYIKNTEIKISFYFIAVVSLMLAVSKNYFTFYIFLFCLLHESGHLITMLIFRKPVNKLEFGYYGIKIIADNNIKSILSEVIILLSGPVVNLILFIILSKTKFTILAEINLSLCVFNMLPIYCLDGGNIFSLFISPAIFRKLSMLTDFIVILLGSLILLYSKTNYSVLFVGIYLLIGQIK